MTHFYRASNSAIIYRQQLKDLVENPDHIITVRGRPTRELLNVVTEITSPRARCQIVPGRKLSPWLMLSESLWLLAGRDDVAALEPYNKRISEFSDNGRTLYGAYGKRIADQIPNLLQRLIVEPNDRRAVLQIWREEDLTAITLDPPCNDLAMFKLRDENLHMTVICRSNDLHWGLHAVNLPQFSILLEYLAARLGVGVGTQTHLSQSLHIYTDVEGQKITDRMLAAMDEPLQELRVNGLFPSPLPSHITHKEFAEVWCSAVLDGYGKQPRPFPFLEFVDDFLQAYREPDNKDPLRHAAAFSSWVRMAEEFWKK